MPPRAECEARLPGRGPRLPVSRSARAFHTSHHGPWLLLADEPTGALDGASGRKVIELLVEVHREIGATLVVVTHDPWIASHLARTIHLEPHGSIAAATDAR